MKTSTQKFRVSVLVAGISIIASSASAAIFTSTTTINSTPLPKVTLINEYNYASSTTASTTPTTPVNLTVRISSPEGCPVVTSFMKTGIANKSSEVTRLQKFLKDSEGLDVDVNGTFDNKTEAAVVSFQKKYTNEILAPWDATKASGIVYLTTAKKINQLACGVPLSLDGGELAVIENYKKGGAEIAVVPGTPSGDAALIPSNTDGMKAVGQADPIEDIPYGAEDSDTNVAAASAALGGGTMAQRFWVYLVGLFR